MYISCCLCNIFRVCYARISRRKPSFQWNMGFSVRVWGNANFSIQITIEVNHVCIPNAKLGRWGSKPTRGPNANGFASQWNIIFTYLSTCPQNL